MPEEDHLDLSKPYNTAFWAQLPSYHTQNGRQYNLDGSPRGAGPAPEVPVAEQIPADVELHEELVPALEGAPDNDSTPELLVAKSGKPFVSEAVAQAVLLKKNLDPGLYLVVPYQGGFAITAKAQE